jgi:ABC-type sugar transport system, permease component
MRHAHRVFIYIGLAIMCVVSLLPIYWMVVSSIRPEAEIFSSTFRPIPSTVTLEHYVKLIQRTNFRYWLWNSVFTTVASTALALLVSTMAGFAFSRYRFVGKNVLFLIVLASVSIPEFVTIVPVFGMMSRMGLVDTYASLILPFGANALGIFLMRQYMEGIPEEVFESGRIDGCSEWRLYWNIMLPVIKPAVGATGIFIFLGSWNRYMWPLVMTRSDTMFVLPVGLATLKSDFIVQYGQLMAGATLSVVPIMLAFLFFQKQFVQGLTAGAVKG